MKMLNMKTSALIFILSFMLLFSGCTQKNNSISLTGTIEADKFDISSVLTGKIVKINFSEGDVIKPGDIAASLDTSTLKIQKKQAEANVNVLNYRYLETKDSSPSDQISQINGTLNQIKTNLTGQQSMLDFLNQSLETVQRQYNSISDSEKKSDISQKIAELNGKIISTKNSIDMLNAQYKSAAEQLKTIKSHSTNNAVQGASASVDQAKAALDLINLQIDESNIKAAKGGTVVYVAANEGQVITPGMPILSLQDLENLHVKFYIPENMLNRISIGQEIKMVSDSDKSQSFAGKITFISSEGEFTPKNVQTKDDASKVYYAFKVKLNQQYKNLKPGMMLDFYIE